MYQIYQACFDCDALAIIVETEHKALAPYTPDALFNMVRTGLLSCAQCGSPHILLTDTRDHHDESVPLVLYQFPHKAGPIAESERVSSEWVAQSVCIPYGLDKRDTARRACWVDTKASRDAIKALPEVRSANQVSDEWGGSRALENALITINDHPRFASHGCAWESQEYDGADMTYGYIDISLSPLPESHFEPMQALVQRLYSHLAEHSADGTRYLLKLKLGISEHRPRYVLDAEVVAMGRGRADAFLHWESALQLLLTGLLAE